MLNKDEVMTISRMNKKPFTTCPLGGAAKKDNSIPLHTERQKKLNHLLLDAVYEGDIELAKEALKQGACVNFEGPGEASPLHVAAMGRNRELVNLIIDHGAKILNQDQLNEELFAAVKDNNIKAVKQVIEEGAKVNSKNRYGNTPLHFAAGYGHTEIAKMLIDAGANVNATTSKHGNTALHWSSEHGHTEIAKMLIDAGADVHAKDEDGVVPLQWATWGGYADMVSLFKQHGGVL